MFGQCLSLYHFCKARDNVKFIGLLIQFLVLDDLPSVTREKSKLREEIAARRQKRLLLRQARRKYLEEAALRETELLKELDRFHLEVHLVIILINIEYSFTNITVGNSCYH